MPNKRAPGQKLINVPMTVKFIASLNRSVREAGYDDRSKFIRDAITEKLQRGGYEVPEVEDRMAPARTGKGGRPTHHSASAPYEMNAPQNLTLNDPQSGTASSPAAADAAPAALQGTPHYGPLKRAGKPNKISSGTAPAAKSLAASGVAKGKTESQARAPKPPTGGTSDGKQ